MEMKKPQFMIIFAAIILLAVVVRFYRISSNPPGLYWDETAFGYDAYSILKTGHDQHGRAFPAFFESFGDWKLPVYFYLLVPSIKIFGLTELAVRFPSAFFAVLTVILMFLLVKKLTRDINLSLYAAFFLAISPWHIQFSRGGFESVPGLFFTLFATLLFLKAVEKDKITFFLLSALFFVLSMYAYHAYRIFTPLFVLVLAVLYLPTLRKVILKLTVSVIFAAVLLAPLAVFSLSSEGKIRAVSQTAFKEEDFQQARLDFDQKSKKPLRFMSKYLYQKPVYYSFVAIKGYLEHFSPSFLFLKGDQTGRHSQVDMGQLFIFESVLILFSFLVFKLSNLGKIMIWWLILSPIPAIIVQPTPHAYRTLQMVIPLAYFSALGAQGLLRIKKFTLLKIAFFAFSIYWFLTYLHMMFVHYPKKFSADWQDGYRQMAQKVKKYEGAYDQVYITNINQVPYIYVLFYTQYDPARFINLSGSKDRFDKYNFISQGQDVYNKGRILYVAPSWEKVDGNWIDAVNDSQGRHLYSLWEVGASE
jgi:4-amino-4-deoxy-L-arabinose transferase-like glycosyltransferase